jgi:hypothetical protein
MVLAGKFQSWFLISYALKTITLPLDSKFIWSALAWLSVPWLSAVKL